MHCEVCSLRNLLVMNHFPTIFPPDTGGVLRYFHIYHQLSQCYDITLLSQKFTPKVEVIHYSDTFREFRMPVEDAHYRITEQLKSEGTGPEFSTHAALCCALIDEPARTFLHYYHRLYPTADIIIHDSPFLLKHDVHFGSDHKPRIYNSHNLESEFAKHVWYGARSHDYIKLVTRLEETLVRQATLVFATSEQERDGFIKAFSSDPSKIKIAPNGIHPGAWKPRIKKRTGNARVTAFFIGSMHQPNIEIVHFIISQLADLCGHMDFIIAGPCGDDFSHVDKKNINILGQIDEKEKLQLFSEVNIAINPASFGTGTNIKTLEFLSAGIPLVSTQVGVRGLHLVQGTHYLHAEKENFAMTLNRISGNKALLEKIALHGQSYVNQTYSWEGIAKKLKEQIDSL
ncbi:hypothetical protein JCM16163A_20090 [Paenibacillus sp. YK5]